MQAARVVDKLDVDPVDAFSLVLFLLVLEDVLVEIILKMLVGVVYAELLETGRETDTIQTVQESGSRSMNPCLSG